MELNCVVDKKHPCLCYCCTWKHFANTFVVVEVIAVAWLPNEFGAIEVIQLLGIEMFVGVH